MLSRLVGGLSLRVIGALAAVAVFNIFASRSGARGVDPVDVSLAAAFLAFAALFLWPGASDRIVRRRPGITARMLWGAFLTLLVVIVLYAGYLSVLNLGLVDTADLQRVRLGAICVLAVFFWSYVLPGSCAKGLIDRRRSDSEILSGAIRGDHIRRRQADRPGNTWRLRVTERHANVPPERYGARDGAGLFRATSFATLVAGLIVVGFFAAGFYGTYEAQFLPTAKLAAAAEQYRWWIVGAGAALLGAALLLAPDRNSAIASAGPTGRLAFGLAGGAVFTGIFTVTAVSVGLPGLHSLLAAGQPATEKVVVTGTGAEIRRGCDHVLYVRPRGDLDAGPHQLCDVPEVIWSAARPGQTLTLRGSRTEWGFRYETISR